MIDGNRLWWSWQVCWRYTPIKCWPTTCRHLLTGMLPVWTMRRCRAISRTWQIWDIAGSSSPSLDSIPTPLLWTLSPATLLRGMLAYVQDIQRQERTHGVETLSHQTWSGANYYDQLLKTVTGGVSSTAAMGKGKGRPFDFVDVLFLICFLYYFVTSTSNQIVAGYAQWSWEWELDLQQHVSISFV